MAIISGSADDLLERISLALIEAAEELEGYGRTQSFSPSQQRRFLRYAPFLRELAGRSSFCEDLSNVQISEADNFTERELYALFPHSCRIQLPC